MGSEFSPRVLVRQVSASRQMFKLIDFGAATLEFDCRNSYVQSRWYRAPEVMLGVPWGDKVDVWSLGCVLVELIVGRPIFYGPSVEFVLAAQAAVLGDIPDKLLRASSLLRTYYTPDRQLFTVDPQVSNAQNFQRSIRTEYAGDPLCARRGARKECIWCSLLALA